MDTARHVRIFEPAATDDFVTKRELAIKEKRDGRIWVKEREK